MQIIPPPAKLNNPYQPYNPAILLMPAFVTNVPSIPIPLPSSGSPLDMANSVMTLPIGSVGVIMLLYKRFMGGIMALKYHGRFGMNGWMAA